MYRKKYCVTDCETATLPIADEIANGDAQKKKKIAIMRPLIYDIGWTICDRDGFITDKKNFLIAETFSVPQIFNTAYYREKRPMYLELLKKGEIKLLPWNDVMDIYLNDIKDVEAVGAFNSAFDFKKAIPFTELYISKIYSPDYTNWYNIQSAICRNIAENKPAYKKDEETYENNVFRFRNNTYPLFDLWGLSTKYLLNNYRYKNACLAHNMISDSGMFFKTSAESTYKYLKEQYDFEEAHTALDDAIIETYILSRITKRHALETGIETFPFKALGETHDFIQENQKVKLEYTENVVNRMREHYEQKYTACVDNDNLIGYCTQVKRKLNGLEMYLGLPLTGEAAD